MDVKDKCSIYIKEIPDQLDFNNKLSTKNTNEMMHCHCGTNNRAPRWTFTDPCKPEVRPGAREESASPVWLAATAMNARDTTKVYIWRLDNGCGPALYMKCHRLG